MVTLHLDIHDFLHAIEGFARGSHLRQHVWSEIVYPSIPQLTDDEKDFLWFMLRRNLWECYFYEISGKPYTHVGHEDFLQAMAALHRGNRWKVKFRSGADRRVHTATCYRYGNQYKPLFVRKGKNEELQSFNAYIPSEWVITAEKKPAPENRYVELGKEEWWNDIDIYNKV